ncbi:hypothetical protein PUN28_012119 [Cardiocondyla obscurior]
MTLFLHIVFVSETLEEVIAISPLCISTITIFFKIFAVIINRDQLINLIETFESKPCKACNKDEIDVQMKFDRSIRSYTIYYILLCTFSCSGAVAAGIFDILERRLPYNAYVPWDCTSLLAFLISSLTLIICLIVVTTINAATETTILGLCLQTCAQFEILKHRLASMAKREVLSPKSPLNNTFRKTCTLSENVSHHLCIIRLVQEINYLYRHVIFVQFFVSILVLCSTVYHVSSHLTVKTLTTLIVFLFSMFVQIFIYCIAGDQVTTKSFGLSEVVYNIDWTFMTISERKDLLMIMKRSTKPVKLTSSFLVTLSLESYGNLLKATFSAFNLLQQF